MNNLPDPAAVLDLIEAFRRSKTLFAAVSLGIFERLPGQAHEVRKNGEDLGTLERFLGEAWLSGTRSGHRVLAQ
jgi:hypothetical protein